MKRNRITYDIYITAHIKGGMKIPLLTIKEPEYSNILPYMWFILCNFVYLFFAVFD